jgi:hypothetical protein
MLVRSHLIVALTAATAVLAGCADSNSLFGNSANLTTSSVAQATAAPKQDPVCVALSNQIDGLRKEGVAEKIEKASQKKYKMTTAELVKADQLIKANTDFQGKCSAYKPTVAAVAPPASTNIGSSGPTAATAAAAVKAAPGAAAAAKEAVATAAKP